MIYGIGIDLVSIKRIKEVIDRWGMRFINRVFTDREIDFCLKRPKSAQAFASRFAAKEAFSKAIGLGMRKGITWRDIETLQQASGKPDLKISGKSLSLCEQERITNWHITLSDENGFSIAVVVLEKGNIDNYINNS